ncbi:hypothetical protein DEU56DRAFT_906447 [Suillus clintonianus]|uniref:uncharacterized protein n=1 Tax=Suillus clintonianus TaxID=1904413 RepID=UPI001B8749E3|nr:uncharacterized protein DEU56DRAFT_906447 [Suillus clintonianus]KAG2156285.1 hypothetical protein DEU56DRAFT_906447 [Suillus clintonianus]
MEKLKTSCLKLQVAARPISTLPNTESSATASTTFKARLHNLLNWWPNRTGHALPPIVDVPLAQGKERNASADAPPKNSGEWIADEDYVPSRPPSTNSNSQPPAVQINTGEHGNGRLCGCF